VKEDVKPQGNMPNEDIPSARPSSNAKKLGTKFVGE
jgi:hypothetical protein